MDKCFLFFMRDYGYSVCIKECMFNRVGYTRLKVQYDNKNRN